LLHRLATRRRPPRRARSCGRRTPPSRRRIGDAEFIAEAGSYILKPRRIPHTFWNPDDRPARILEIITPSGLEEMFAEFGELGARGELTPETMGATAARYGSTMSMDWVPDLIARYGLTLMG
jgi:Cupin domain.